MTQTLRDAYAFATTKSADRARMLLALAGGAAGVVFMFGGASIQQGMNPAPVLAFWLSLYALLIIPVFTLMAAARTQDPTLMNPN